jgi:hypothetical protein
MVPEWVAEGAPVEILGGLYGSFNKKHTYSIWRELANYQFGTGPYQYWYQYQYCAVPNQYW